MEKSKILKKILIPSVSILTLGAVTTVATSCSCCFSLVSVTGVELDKSEISVDIDHSGKLEATVFPDNATDKTVTWSSDHPDIVSVDQIGQIKGITLGKATITVTTNDGNFSATCNVTVNQIHVKSIEFDKNEAWLVEDGTERLTYSINPEDATDQTVTWGSSNSNIVSVDEYGNIRGNSVGEADITVTTNDGGKTDTCHVTVSSESIPVTGVQLNKTQLVLVPEQTATLIATVLPTNATDKSVVWSTDNKSVATVDVNGKVTVYQMVKQILPLQHMTVDTLLHVMLLLVQIL